MGANLNTREYPGTKTKAEILKQWEDDCEMSRHESGHSYSGEIGMLSGTPSWADKEFPDENTANEHICEKHKKWSQPLAVSYKARDGTKWWMIGGWCSS
jgi:hypothetical protein